MAESSDLDDLLKRMPDIAKAVSAFPESVQQSAFDTLMAAAAGTATVTAPVGSTGGTTPKAQRQPRGKKRTASSDGASGARKARRTAGAPTQVRELDLAPKGKTSLATFVAEKGPKTNHDYNVVAVYYLSEELGVPAVTLNQVFTCYRAMRWKEPANLANSLALTASRKRFFDTSNLDDIKLMPAGRTRVEHELPPKKKSK